MQLPSTDTSIKSVTELSRGLTTELTDSEVQAVAQIIYDVQQKYARKRNTHENLEALRDEVLTRLMEVSVLAEVDPAPALYGEPPVVEIIGKIRGDAQHVYGHDFEKAIWEAQKAGERKEEVLGQKEEAPGKAKRRADQERQK